MAEIRLSAVRKSYGREEIIRGVSVTIPDGEFVVILGPSGCGKSTLLRMIAGLESVSSGEIFIAGVCVNALEPRARGCAMVFQNYALYPHMRVADNIGYALKVAGVPRKERMARIKDVAAMLDLVDYLDRKPSELSGGQRQRVAIGRAMIRAPKVFLYDEPLSNLDAKLRVKMRVEIRKLHEKLKTTSVFVTHDQLEAMSLADIILIMEEGKIAQIGSPREIYHNPRTTYVASFIGSPGMNLLDGVADPVANALIFRDGQQLDHDFRGYPSVRGAVTIGVRAEHLRVVAATMAGTKPQGLNLKLDFREEMGASQQLHGTLAGQSLIALSTVPSSLASGEEFCVSVAAEHIHLFDAATGVRIEAQETSLKNAINAPTQDAHAQDAHARDLALLGSE